MLGSRELFRPGRWHKVSQVGGILSVTVSVLSDTMVNITWSLSVEANGQVEYGTTSALGSTTTLAAQYLTLHSQTIGTGVNPTPLLAGTLYYFRVKSVTEGGLTLYSDIATFSTTGSDVVTAGPRPAPVQPTGPSVKVIGTDTIAVDNTGATDVTAKLQNILNTLNAGDILVFDQTGSAAGYEHGTYESPSTPLNEYRISNILYLDSVPDNVTLCGYGTRIRQYATNGIPTFLNRRTGRDRHSYLGFELHGSNSPWSRTAQIYTGQGGEGGHGIGLWRRHTNTTIEDCWIHHMCGDGVYQSGFRSDDYVSGNGTQYITVRYNRIEDNKRQGIVNNVGLDWDISYNVIGNQGGGNIDCEDVKGSDYTLPKSSGVIEHNVFEQTTWYKSAVFANSSFHINYAQGWNDVDGPPNYSQYGPWYVRNNTITGMGPSAIWNPATETLVWFTMSQRQAYSPASYTGETRMQGLYITGNVFDLPAAQQLSRLRAVTAGYVDGLTVTGNVLQNLSVSASTTGTAACTDVTISGNT